MENKLFTQLTTNELDEVNGGGFLTVGAIILGGVLLVSFGVGIYMGWKERKNG